MEGVQTLPAAAEQEDEEDVAENTEDGNHQQHHSLDVELEEVGQLVVRVTGRHPARLGVLRGVTESWGESERGRTTGWTRPSVCNECHPQGRI